MYYINDQKIIYIISNQCNTFCFHILNSRSNIGQISAIGIGLPANYRLSASASKCDIGPSLVLSYSHANIIEAIQCIIIRLLASQLIIVFFCNLIYHIKNTFIVFLTDYGSYTLYWSYEYSYRCIHNTALISCQIKLVFTTELIAVNNWCPQWYNIKYLL